MRRVIAAQNLDRSIGDSLEKRSHIFPRPQRRIHLAVCVEVLDRVVAERDMMRANFAADLYAARPRFPQNPDASRRADVLAMDMMIAELREENVSHHDCFLARARPAG